MKNIVTSLEVSKQLKETGYPQESLFYWVVGNKFMKNPNEWYLNERVYNGTPSGFENYISAPTSSELMEMLPYVSLEQFLLNKYPWRIIDKEEKDRFLGLDILVKTGYNASLPKEKIYVCSYLDWAITEDKNLCDCLAKMWLYLKSNNLIKI